jgi:serine/threonine-protein kinase
MVEDPEKRHTVTVGRYLLHRQIARGGMATIHIARLMGDEGFSRIVAAKRLLPEFAEDSDFVAMFLEEARIASKVHHPNVVPVLDLVTTTDEVMLVQEYVHGVPLHVLLRNVHKANQKIPVRIAVSIAAQVLAGLHAAHRTVDEMGEPLDIVHRDVSPQNVMVSIDGTARLLDFGVAKATMAAHVTREGMFKGKLAYSAPEQVRGKPVQQSDVYALAVVLWELLVGHRMHGSSQGEAELIATILGGTIPTITEALSNEADWGAIDSDEWKLLAALEPIVAKGLAVDLAQRYESAADMEEDLTREVPPASTSEIAAWLRAVGKDFLEGREKIMQAEEASWRRTHGTPGTLPHRRFTPLPTELRPVSTQMAAVRVTLASLIRDRRVVIAALGALVLLLGVGVVFAMQSDDAPVARTTPAMAPAPTAPTTEPDVATAAPAATQARPLDPSPQVAPIEKTVPREPPPVRRATPRPAPVKVTKKVEEPVPKQEVPRPEAIPEAKPAAAEKSDDCSPPYYFEGRKKVFKTNCL